jgi:hypothetical protein
MTLAVLTAKPTEYKQNIDSRLDHQAIGTVAIAQDAAKPPKM